MKVFRLQAYNVVVIVSGLRVGHGPGGLEAGVVPCVVAGVHGDPTVI